MEAASSSTYQRKLKSQSKSFSWNMFPSQLRGSHLFYDKNQLQEYCHFIQVHCLPLSHILIPTSQFNIQKQAKQNNIHEPRMWNMRFVTMPSKHYNPYFWSMIVKFICLRPKQ